MTRHEIGIVSVKVAGRHESLSSAFYVIISNGIIEGIDGFFIEDSMDRLEMQYGLDKLG